MIYLYLVRLVDEPDMGFTAEPSGRFFVARDVTEEDPAWRAGLRKGEMLRKYGIDQFNPDIPRDQRKKNATEWSASALGVVNAQPPCTIVAIQGKKPTKLTGIHKSRHEYMTNQKACVASLGGSFECCNPC